MKQFELIKKINDAARLTDFSFAEGMLFMFNEVHGTKYGFLNRRVVRFEKPDASTAIKYGSGVHDVYTELHANNI